MARIKTYAEDSIISDKDIVIGSDFENEGNTKNYTFKSIINFLQGKLTSTVKLTNAQRIASTPSIGDVVYCTDTTEGLYVFKSTGWVMLL